MRAAHLQAGADGGGGGTAWFRKKPSVPALSGPGLDVGATAAGFAPRDQP
ncbi:hypothetical protein ARTSIC4J27_1049 [Pseudarthrobacter siccitolerans]|uniref:Uncharacterized protein n=1 Tax=Pseudarthrobacter siccitolerans TaxID=861266 RepID=A0A024H061_9MICC|nr:hypothetical protein ARTSIC4J27_1049 [Pseudarthrobacter siccitolerans]